MIAAVLRALERRLREGLQGFLLEDPGQEGGLKQTPVFPGALPDLQASEPDEKLFPFILVRFAASQDFEEGGEVTAEILIGVYAKDGPRGEEWLGVLVDRIRMLLLGQRVLEERFELVFPLRCERANTERRERQYHLAAMTTIWTVQGPQPTRED